MSITSKTIQGVGESGCLEYAAYQVSGDAGNNRTHKLTFRTQQAFEVEKDEDDHLGGAIVHLTITGDQEFSDIVRFINQAVKT